MENGTDYASLGYNSIYVRVMVRVMIMFMFMSGFIFNSFYIL